MNAVRIFNFTKLDRGKEAFFKKILHIRSIKSL